MNPKILPILGVLFFCSAGAEAQLCSLNVKNLQEAFATFCSGERVCCTPSFYLNENAVALDHIAQFHRQCSRNYHPDKNQSLEAEERMKQCNGGREALEMHFSCLQKDRAYGSWFFAILPMESYLKECRRKWGKPLTEADLQKRKEEIQTVFQKIRAGDYGL